MSKKEIDFHTKRVIINKSAIPVQAHYRAWGVPGGWGSQLSRQSAHESGQIVSPVHGRPGPPRKYSSYSFVLEAESTPEP